jgi:hypothetical protein
LTGLKRLKPLCLAVLAVLALQGCGVKLIYNNMDRVVPWYVDNYIDLSPAQRRYLKRRMKEHLYWNRTTQLVSYATTLEGAARSIEDGLTAAELEAVIDNVKIHRAVLIDEIVPTTAVLLISSSDEQLLEFAMRVDEGNEEYLEDEQRDRVELEADWAKEVKRSLKDLIGRLTAEQRQLIEGRSREVEFAAPAQVAFRRNWQRDFLRALAKRDDPVWFTERFAYMAHNYEEWFTDDFREVEKRDDVFYRGLVLDVDRTLTPEQRRNLMDWFLNLAQDLRELAADADEKPPRACTVEASFEDLCALQARILGHSDENGVGPRLAEGP